MSVTLIMAPSMTAFSPKVTEGLNNTKATDMQMKAKQNEYQGLQEEEEANIRRSRGE